MTRYGRIKVARHTISYSLMSAFHQEDCRLINTCTRCQRLITVTPEYYDIGAVEYLGGLPMRSVDVGAELTLGRRTTCTD